MGTSARTAWGSADRVLSAAINASANGSNTLVAAVPGKRIVVLLYVIVAAAGAGVNVRFESGGGAILDGPCNFTGNGGAAPPFSEQGHFATLPGESLVMNLSAAWQVGGHVLYGLVG